MSSSATQSLLAWGKSIDDDSLQKSGNSLFPVSGVACLFGVVAAVGPILIYTGASDFQSQSSADADLVVGLIGMVILAVAFLAIMYLAGQTYGGKALEKELEASRGFQNNSPSVIAEQRGRELKTLFDASMGVNVVAFVGSLFAISALVDLYYTQQPSIDQDQLDADAISGFVISCLVLGSLAILMSGIVIGVSVAAAVNKHRAAKTPLP